MLQPGDIRGHLIDRLAAIFGAPKNADSLATELARHCRSHATAFDLEALSDRIVATRKAKGFPPAAELIQAVRSIVPASGAPTFRRRVIEPPVIQKMPPPRQEDELRGLPAGSTVSHEEAMILTGGRPARGRW